MLWKLESRKCNPCHVKSSQNVLGPGHDHCPSKFEQRFQHTFDEMRDIRISYRIH